MDEFGFTGWFFFQAEDGIRDWSVTGVQTCALPISTAGTCAVVVAGLGGHRNLARYHFSWRSSGGAYHGIHYLGRVCRRLHRLRRAAGSKGAVIGDVYSANAASVGQ